MTFSASKLIFSRRKSGGAGMIVDAQRNSLGRAPRQTRFSYNLLASAPFPA
jgi:hypothetical protein